MAFSISDIVRVTASIQASGVTRREFGRALFVTTDTTLPAAGEGRVRSFASLEEIESVFGSGTQPRLAATAYFGQNPRPRNLIVGRWINTTASTRFVGTTPDDAPADLTESDYSFTLNGITVSAINLASATTTTAVATAIQTRVRAADTSFNTNGAEVVVAFENGVYEISFPDGRTLDTQTIGNAGAGNNLAPLIGLDDATYVQGAPAEPSITDALSAFAGIDSSFSFVTVENQQATNASVMTGIAGWVNTRNLLFSAQSFDPDALTQGDSTSIAYQLSQLQLARTFVTHSTSTDYKCMAIAGVLASVNLGQPNSLITAKFRTLQGFAADDYTTTQRNVLDGKRINYYTTFGNNPIYAEGVTLKSGLFIDTQLWLDWAANAIQTAIWSQLLNSRSVPQTAAGVASIRSSIVSTLDEGVVNGGIAPGQVSPDFTRDIRETTGSQDFDGFLSSGYLVHIGSLAAQSQTDREERKLPPVKCWLKGSGSIHSAEIALSFEA